MELSEDIVAPHRRHRTAPRWAHAGAGDAAVPQPLRAPGFSDPEVHLGASAVDDLLYDRGPDLIYQLDRDVALAEEETDRQALDRWFDGVG